MTIRSFEELAFSALLANTEKPSAEAGAFFYIKNLMGEIRNKINYDNDYLETLKVFHTDIVNSVSPTSSNVDVDITVSYIDIENKIIGMELSVSTVETDLFEREDGTYGNIMNLLNGKATDLYEIHVDNERAYSCVSKLKIELYYFN